MPVPERETFMLNRERDRKHKVRLHNLRERCNYYCILI